MIYLKSALQQDEEFQKLPVKAQAVYLNFADYFDQYPDLITMNTEELVKEVENSTHQQWRTFLVLPLVDQFIQQILKHNAQIAFRKASAALTIEAANGNTTAAKQVTELAGIFNTEQNNKIHILTYVPRPQEPQQETHTNGYTPNFTTDDPLHQPDPTILGSEEDTTEGEPTA